MNINDPLINDLNAAQQEAVCSPLAHRLILAGAGSGKTRVLVHRIAWLMQKEHLSPFGILSVTFTNKAAHEMRQRIEQLLSLPASGMWVGTFHGLSHKLLRLHHEAAGLPESFQILDSDDQLRLVKRVMRSHEIDESKWPPKQAQWFINHSKEEGLRPHQLPNNHHYELNDTLQLIYRDYEEVCQRSGLVDFSELILRSLELLQNNPDIARHYQERFHQILVDEFQDTNNIQYQWLQALCGPHSYIMAVGDDDQSIYSWRGAKIENIHRFSQDYPQSRIIRLEQNYRSTETILSAANAVIANNTHRLGKELWTDGKKGELISLYSAYNEQDEAYFIAETIKSSQTLGFQYSECAILYRSNAQSRVIEERLLEARIPYRIYGGQKFFERAEIKDVLAYLRLLSNRHDDAALERVINLPTRGIGNTTLLKLRELARDNRCSLWEAATFCIEHHTFSARAEKALQHFIHLMDQLDHDTLKWDISDQTEHVISHSGLLEHYKKDTSEKGRSRVENLEELITATGQFHVDETDSALNPLDAFLAHVSLETGETQADEQSDCVNLMTLHAAKGLEFPLVFLSGLEEGLFPHKMALNEAQGLEEERRLCYVGMTRAMKKLYISYAETRRLHGTEQYHSASRFIKEIPDSTIDAIRSKTKVSRPHAYHQSRHHTARSSASTYRHSSSETVNGLPIGQRVKHAKFGEGTIINYEGSGDHARIQVEFVHEGTKWLVASFAKLEAC